MKNSVHHTYQIVASILSGKIAFIFENDCIYYIIDMYSYPIFVHAGVYVCPKLHHNSFIVHINLFNFSKPRNMCVHNLSGVPILRPQKNHTQSAILSHPSEACLAFFSFSLLFSELPFMQEDPRVSNNLNRWRAGHIMYYYSLKMFVLVTQN